MSEIRYIISDASKRIDAEPHALRYWEEELGLEIPRNEMGHRYYREEDIKILKNVKLLKEQGFQLRAIKMILPNIHKIETLDARSMLLLRNELNERVFELESRQEIQELQAAKQKHSKQSELEYTNLIHLEDVRADHANLDSLESETDEEQIKSTTPMYSDNIESDKAEIESVNSIKEGIIDREDKMVQFRNIMSELILKALRDNNDEMSNSIGKVVSLNVAKEIDYQFREKEQREEERYKHLDETIRAYQRGRAEIAAAQVEGGKKKNLFKRV